MKNWQFIFGVIFAALVIFGMSMWSGYCWGWRDGIQTNPSTTTTTIVECEIDTKTLEDAGYIEKEPIQGWVWSNPSQTLITRDIDWDAWNWNAGYREGYIDGFYSDTPPLDWFKIYNFKEEK